MNPRHHSPGLWVTTLYFAQGLPYVMVNTLAALALFQLGWSAADAALYTSGLNLPWVVKPLWGPLVERVGSRRAWIWAMQAGGAACLFAAAVTLPERDWLWATLALFLALGFVSATHDIAADGFYIVALEEKLQAMLSGLRNTFFRLALLAGSGGLVILIGRASGAWGVETAWRAGFATAGGALLLLACYHFLVLPAPARDLRAQPPAPWLEEFVKTFVAFVRRPGFGRVLLFILFYRFAESQLLKGNQPFLLAPRAAGGLGLPLADVGLFYGTLGLGALMLGGVLGGLAISRTGLRRQLWPMALALNGPHLLYVWLAAAQPESLPAIAGCIAVEQFGYGYGFAAYMVYLLHVARGPTPTAHYALCTGLMAGSVMLAGYLAAAVLEGSGNNYLHFFWWVVFCSVLSLGVLWKLPLDPEFGRRG